MNTQHLDSPGELALEACKVLCEWAEAHGDPLPLGMQFCLSAAEDALRAQAESEAQP